MLTVISPAKKLSENPVPGAALTDPAFAREALALARIARGLSVQDLRRLMNISDPLARLNHRRFASFAAGPAAQLRYPAIHCFAGDTYTGLEARTMEPDALLWADRHLRILSGLYGLLRPHDAIQPYRLDMGSKLATPRGRDLYAFWGDRIAKALVALAAEVGTEVLVNCASTEYFTAANRKALKLRVITPVFLDGPESAAKVVSFWAKTARGAMARHICTHRLTDPADLRGFRTGGYAFRADLSAADRMVFHRAQAVAA